MLHKIYTFHLKAIKQYANKLFQPRAIGHHKLNKSNMKLAEHLDNLIVYWVKSWLYYIILLNVDIEKLFVSKYLLNVDLSLCDTLVEFPLNNPVYYFPRGFQILIN
jgi:hypothetical protein